MLRLPKAHQYAGYLWLRENPRGLCLDEMRLGKTYTAAMSVRGLGPGVVGCPASAKTIWRDEFLVTDPRLKIDIVKGRSHEFRPDADLYIINYDVLADNFYRIPHHAKYNWFIPDEFHRLKNPEARRTGAAQAIIRNARIVHPLSGTPMPSRPIEWWPVLNALGVTTLDYEQFARRYAGAFQAAYTKHMYKGIDARGASHLEELRDLIAPHVIRRTKRQIFSGYRKPELRLITFDRPVDARESDFTPEMLRQFDNPIVNLEGLAAVLKASALKKIPDCIEFIEDRLQEEQKIIVFAWNKEVIKALQSGLADYLSVTVTGESSDTQRAHAVITFRHDPRYRLFFGNILSAGEALDLSSANCTIFVQTTWVPKDLFQAVERTESMAKLDDQATAYILTTEGSIDHYQLNSMFEKMKNINAVLPVTLYDDN